MIVINKMAGIKNLTYKTGEYKDERGNKRIKSESFAFLPGNNEIDPEIWQKIRKGLTEAQKDYYDTILKVVQPTTDENGYTIGPDEGEIDILELNVVEATDLIAGTMELDPLEKYRNIEKGRKDIKPRKMVLNKIKEQIAEIKDFDKKREEEKNKANIT